MRTLVTNADSFDVDAFFESKSMCPSIRDFSSRFDTDGAPQRSELQEDLFVDGFASFYKYAPELRTPTPTGRLINSRVVGEAMKLEEYERLRTYTRGDPIASMAALQSLRESFGLSDDLYEEAERTHKAAEDIQRELESGTVDPARLEELKKSLEEAKESADRAFQEAQAEIRKGLRIGLREASDEAEAAIAAAAAFGYGTEAGTISRSVPLGERAKIATLLSKSPRILEIMKLAGRMVIEAARIQRNKPSHSATTLAGIDQGDDLSQVVPAEWALLGDDDTEILLYDKFAAEKLQQYKLEAKDPEIKGPIMVGLDVSGSMSGYPDVWSKAVALALYSIARREKRGFSLLLFSVEVVGSATIPPDTPQMETLADLLQILPSGGTSFEAPLQAMARIARHSHKEKADIVLVTDGRCSVGSDFLEHFSEVKKEQDMKILSVRIGSNSSSGDDLERFSDQVWNLSGDILGNEAEVKETLFAI